MPLVECVPNFSEGRRAEVIDAVAASVQAQGAALLDVQRDADHHRSVITFAGQPDTVIKAMLAAARVALQHIDMRKHAGVHPRVGAVDVVPFVPLRGCTLADCIALSRQFGARAAAELGVPVYYYGASATRPERRKLADLRRGGYEALQKAIEIDENWRPDEGPSTLGPGGAMLVGARMPLIAYNVMLQNDDLEAARHIARSIRESDGGLPAVQAIGLMVRGRAQVSINLLDYHQTPLVTLIAALQRAADEAGAALAEGEIIGLAPQEALMKLALSALRLSDPTIRPVLEYRLGDTLSDYREIPFE